MINFRRIGITLIEHVVSFQNNVEQAIKQLNDEPFVRGKFFTVTTTTTADFNINTGLSSVSGWICTDTNVSVTFLRVANTNASILTLTPSAAGTYTFWVF